MPGHLDSIQLSHFMTNLGIFGAGGDHTIFRPSFHFFPMRPYDRQSIAAHPSVFPPAPRLLNAYRVADCHTGWRLGGSTGSWGTDRSALRGGWPATGVPPGRGAGREFRHRGDAGAHLRTDARSI